MKISVNALSTDKRLSKIRSKIVPLTTNVFASYANYYSFAINTVDILVALQAIYFKNTIEKQANIPSVYQHVKNC